jgi:hypothetical protein
MRLHHALAVLLILSTGASAQVAPRPVESVTVIGTRDRQMLQKFVETFAAPTRVTGKMARWTKGVCPVTAGLAPRFAAFVTQHIREVAATAGAPVAADKGCKPNIEIVFTTTPQKLIDGVRATRPGFLGYYDNRSQLEKLAAVTRPIQAWYTTATEDLRGNLEMDSGKTVGPGLEVWLPCPRSLGICLMHLPNARAAAVTGSRLGDGLRSGLYHVIIAADPGRLKDYEMGTLADYIAMLALAQISDPEACPPLSSVTSLFAEQCPQPAAALTANDLGYLRGLYKMSPDQVLHAQESEIAFQMEHALAGK